MNMGWHRLIHHSTQENYSCARERERRGERERERDFKSQNVYRSNSSKTVISSLLLFFNCPVHFWFCSQKKAVCLPVSSLDTNCNSPNAFYLEYTSEASTCMLCCVCLWDSTLNSDCYWLPSLLNIFYNWCYFYKMTFTSTQTLQGDVFYCQVQKLKGIRFSTKLNRAKQFILTFKKLTMPVYHVGSDWEI